MRFNSPVETFDTSSDLPFPQQETIATDEIIYSDGTDFNGFKMGNKKTPFK